MDKFSTKDMYAHFKKQNPESDVTYTLYKHTLGEFFKKVSNEILEGETFNLGHKLGKIRIRKVERNYNKPTIDWGATNKLKAQGINKHVYYTDPYWYRWGWEKCSVALKNKSVYKFTATKGSNGNIKALSRKLKLDEFAHLNFKE